MRSRFFGQYLIAHGYITPPQLLAAVEYQRKYNPRLGELAVALGMFTPFESEQINATQVSRDRLFGEAAIDCGLLTESQLNDALETQRSARVLLGQALETLGYLPRNAIDAALSAYLREETARGPLALPDLPWVAPIFDRAVKLMRRGWDLPCKPGRVRIETSRLTLSDRNARAELRGEVRRDLLIGVPNDVARRAAARHRGEAFLADALEDHVVQDFARVLGEATAELLNARDEQVELRAVVLVDARATLPPEDRIVMVNFLTHLGQVLVGLTL
jgi:hypothetical protein